MRAKLLLPALLAGLLAAPLAVAQDSGFYIEARGGSASVDEDEFDDTATAFEFGGGFRWGGFGIEGGYITFDDFEGEAFNLDVEGELDGYFAGISGRTNFAESWYLSGRLGAFLWDADVSTVICESPNNCAVVSADDDGTDYYAGIGLGYDFSEQFSAGVAYDYFAADADGANLDTSIFWLTLELRFY